MRDIGKASGMTRAEILKTLADVAEAAQIGFAQASGSAGKKSYWALSAQLGVAANFADGFGITLRRIANEEPTDAR